MKDGLSFWLLISIWGVYLVGLLFTNDLKFGLLELNKALLWITLTTGIFLAPKLSRKYFWMILTLFAFGVTVSTFISFTRMLFSNSLGVENFRHVNFITHIPFSFQITFGIFILIYSFFYENWLLKLLKPTYRFIWIIWLLFFLVILKSMLGLIAIYFTAFFLLFFIVRRNIKPTLRKVIIAVSLLFFLLPLIYLGNAGYKFYDIKDHSPINIDKQTKLGNDYTFQFDDKSKENGYYINWYVCTIELEQAWNKKSKIEFRGKDKKGYQISGTLIRYLTSKGLKKDAEGVESLTERDVENIESGIANYIFDTSVYAFYPRIYETIWELDQYLLTGNPNNQSLSQRIEYAKAAIVIIKENFWFGIGTGNYVSAYRDAYKKMNSQLNKNNYGIAHNQYLSYFSKFGLFGFLYIMFALFFVLIKEKQLRNELLILLFVNMLIANLGDSNLETHIGLSYFLFFFCLFLWHSPSELSGKLT
jgi:ABC-type multidrug transport system fused ATPase/permease subunit